MQIAREIDPTPLLKVSQTTQDNASKMHGSNNRNIKIESRVSGVCVYVGVGVHLPLAVNVNKRLNVCLWFCDLCSSSADLVQVSAGCMMQWYQ